MLGGQYLLVDQFLSRPQDELVALIRFSVDFDAHVESLEPGASVSNECPQGFRSVYDDLGHIEAHLIGPAAALHEVDDDGRAMGGETGEGDLRFPGASIAFRTHDGNDPPWIDDLLSSSVPAQQVEELDRLEVDLLMEGVHRGDELFVQSEQVMGLAQAQLHRELSEDRRILASTARVSLVELHHVVVDGG